MPETYCRYRENRHVSMGAEKWLDIELWDSPQDCFQVLKSRGYRIATTHVGMDAVFINFPFRVHFFSFFVKSSLDKQVVIMNEYLRLIRLIQVL